MNLISNLLDDALKIKCLYLFSREELISSHGDITYDFLEKYIPVIEKLTPLNRKKLIESTLEKRKIAKEEKEIILESINKIFNLELVPNRILMSLVNEKISIFDMENTELKIGFSKYLTPRKINVFINEIIKLITISNNEKLCLNYSLIVNVSFFKSFFSEEFDDISFKINDTNISKDLDLKFVSEKYDYELTPEEFQDFYDLARLLGKDRVNTFTEHDNLSRIDYFLKTYENKFPRLGVFKRNVNGTLTYENGDISISEVLETFKLKKTNGVGFFILQLLGIAIKRNFINESEKIKIGDLVEDNICEINKIIFSGVSHQTNHKEVVQLIEPLLKSEKISERKSLIEENYRNWSDGEKTIYYMGDSLGGNIFIHLMYYFNLYDKKGSLKSILECFFEEKTEMNYREVLNFYNGLVYANVFSYSTNQKLIHQIMDGLKNINFISEKDKNDKKGMVVDLRERVAKEKVMMNLSTLIMRPILRVYNGSVFNNYSSVVLYNVHDVSIEKYIEMFNNYKKDFLEHYKNDISEEITKYKEFIEFLKKELEKFKK